MDMQVFTVTNKRLPRLPQVVKKVEAEQGVGSQIRRFNLCLLFIFLILTLLYTYFIGRELYCKEHDAICSTMSPEDEETFAWYLMTRSAAVQRGWNESQNFEIWVYSTQVNWKEVYQNCSEQAFIVYS